MRHARLALAAVLVPLALACNSKPKQDDTATTTAASAKPTESAKPSDAIPAIDMPGAQSNQGAKQGPQPIPAPPDVAEPPADAQKTASGLVSKVLQKGTGTKKPTGKDRVKVNYTGWTKDGQMFDSSVARGEPITFPLDGVIPGWTEGLQLMTVGEKRRLWIPPNLAYGDKPHGGAPAGQLTFDVELLDFSPAPQPPPVPADVKAPPASAKKTESGLAYKLLSSTAKPDAAKPGPNDVALVNYTGWTTDGKMFDSSIPSGEPAAFPVGRVIPGWTEGLQLMKVGDKMRLWIPAKLAYGDKPTRPGAPAGMLVFDVELLDVKPGRPGGMMPPHMPH